MCTLQAAGSPGIDFACACSDKLVDPNSSDSGARQTAYSLLMANSELEMKKPWLIGIGVLLDSTVL